MLYVGFLIKKYTETKNKLKKRYFSFPFLLISLLSVFIWQSWSYIMYMLWDVVYQHVYMIIDNIFVVSLLLLQFFRITFGIFVVFFSLLFDCWVHLLTLFLFVGNNCLWIFNFFDDSNVFRALNRRKNAKNGDGKERERKFRI